MFTEGYYTDKQKEENSKSFCKESRSVVAWAWRVGEVEVIKRDMDKLFAVIVITHAYTLSEYIELYTQHGYIFSYANYTSIKPINTFQSTSTITHTKLLLIFLCTFFQMIFLCIYEYTRLLVYTKRCIFDQM